MTDDILDSLSDAWEEQQVQVGKPKGKKRTISRPSVEPESVRSAMTPTSKMAGPFNRKTIYISPQREREIEKAAAKEHVGLMAFYRFLIDEAWQAYQDGRITPEPAEPIAHRLKNDPQ